jgi:hypothetical protein
MMIRKNCWVSKGTNNKKGQERHVEGQVLQPMTLGEGLSQATSGK